MDSKQSYKVIGLMSGTSLDGLDIACCKFKKRGNGWHFEIEKAATIKYSSGWHKALSGAHNFSGSDLVALDMAYGNFIGDACLNFITKNKLRADFIASHGHTIFHQPKNGFTFQLGDGNAIHASSGMPVVCDFRSLDVARGGEGAPLVPIGDKLLFTAYDVCLNLGGIANLSVDIKGKRMAYDICFLNMGLNYLAEKAGKPYDAFGKWSSDGEIDNQMSKKLAKIYNELKTRRPSLGREIFERQIKPILDSETIPLNNRLRTFTESSVAEIAQAVLSGTNNPKVLCTGGGAFNSFFISRLLDACGDSARLIIPDESVVKFKEALVFAFLGMLRVRGEVNCLRSVTGANRNSSTGIQIGF